jgi:hypothetical protein
MNHQERPYEEEPGVPEPEHKEKLQGPAPSAEEFGVHRPWDQSTLSLLEEQISSTHPEESWAGI